MSSAVEGAPAERETVDLDNDGNWTISMPPRFGTPGGLQWHNLLYPAMFRRTPRKRVLAWMEVSRRQRTVKITDEYGTVSVFGLAASGYTALRHLVCAAGLTVFAPLGIHPGAFPWILESLDDTQHAKLLCSGRGVVSGVHYHEGNKHGAVVSPESWGFSDLPEPIRGHRFVSAVRRVCDAALVGTFDTAASFGEAVLHAFWRHAGLPRVWRLPARLAEWFHTAPSFGGRILTPCVGMVLGEVWEADLRRAYPRQLAKGVPWGTPVFCGRNSEHVLIDSATSHGLWRIRVHEDIVRGPVGIDSGRYGSRVEYDLAAGEYELPLWKEQVLAFLETGQVTMEWLYGYAWDELGTHLAGYVEQMEEYRVHAETAGDPIGAALVKRAVNGAIGRFGMASNYAVIPADDAIPGDRLFVLPVWCRHVDNPLDSPLAALRELDCERTTPIHWLSYIRVAVGLTLWRVQRDEEQRGNRVALENVDGIYFVEKPVSCDDSRVWKLTKLSECWLPYNRAVVFQLDTGGEIYRLEQKLPGIPKSSRANWVEAYRVKVLRKARGP